MNANAKEWHPPIPVVESTDNNISNDTEDNSAKHINSGGSKTTANHKTRRRKQHQRTRQHIYGKKNDVNKQYQKWDISSISNNNDTNAKEICYNDNSTQTSTADSDMISSSTQDVHDQSTSTQNHISKHQEHQKQKQRRRRRRYGDNEKNTDNRSVSRTSDVVDGGGGSHRTHKVANRRRHHKKKVNGSATTEKHPDETSKFNNDECNFPTLHTNTTAPSTYDRTATDDTNWNESLANKLASIEIEEQKQKKYLEDQLQLEEDMKESVQLTKLTYNKPLHTVLDNEEEVDGDDQLESNQKLMKRMYNIQLLPLPKKHQLIITANIKHQYQIPNINGQILN